MSFPGCPDWFLNWQNCPPGPQAQLAKDLAAKAPEISAQFATGTALTTIFNAILVAAQAGTFRLVVDITTLTGADIPVVINVLNARLGYTTSLIDNDLTIAWDYVGVTGLQDRGHARPYP